MTAVSSYKKIITATSLICLAVIIVGTFLFFWKGARQQNYKQEPDIPAHEITSHILSELKITDMTAVPYGQLSRHYDLPSYLIRDFSVYMSTSANKGDELACFRLRDPLDYPDLEGIIARHIEIKSQGFKELSPAEYDKIQQYRIEWQGSYVLVYIGDTPDTVSKIFHTMLA